MSEKMIITSEPDSLAVYLKKIWKYRSLILVFAKRDLKVKYAQTFLGMGWTILQPLTAVVVFTLFFSVLMNFETDYPYVLFVLSGIMIWNLFNYIFTHASSSLLNSQDLIKKMYFPKVLLPISKVLVGLVEFVATFLLFLVLVLLLGSTFEWYVFFSLPVIILVTFFSLGLSFMLSATTLKYRDLNHIVPFLVQFGIWFTPVFYPVSLIPEKWEYLLYLNPMASVVQLFRCAALPEQFELSMLLGIPVTLVTFIIGFFMMKSVEDRVVEII